MKHPTLPALYLGCHVTPEAKNLITFRLDGDGSLIPGSRRDCDNYFTENATNGFYNYRVYRPSVLVEQQVLYVAAGADSYAACYANTNNNEIVALSLDSQGQPTRVLKAFRTSHTGAERLYSFQCDPITRRLYCGYWSTFIWSELAADGLPGTSRFNPLVYAASLWYPVYVPQWQRAYVVYSGFSLRVLKFATDGLGLEMVQRSELGYGDSPCIEVSTKFRKLYNLDPTTGKRLLICTLTTDGRLTSVPRYFPLPGIVGFRCDFAAGKLYAWTEDALWKTFPLDGEGIPHGEPQVSRLGCGEIRDAFVDEKTGKVYVACTQPPSPAK